MTVAPLSFTTVEAFCRLMDVRLEPYEVAALIELDAALFPDVEEAPRREEPPILNRPRWPQRKGKG